MRQTTTAKMLKAIISAYRRIISPWLGSRCRFAPSCSDYAIQALDKHGTVKGSVITIKRVCRCHPWGGHGFDPVPDTASTQADLPGKTHTSNTQRTITTPPGGHA